jgi:hypothetical protein
MSAQLFSARVTAADKRGRGLIVLPVPPVTLPAAGVLPAVKAVK